MDVETSWVDLPAESGKMAVFVAQPKGQGPYPGIAYFHPILGITDSVKETAQRIASEGFVVAVPHMYHRLRYRDEFKMPEERPLSREAAASITHHGVAADSRVALNYLRENPAVATDRIGVIGYCFGGTVAFLAVCYNKDVKASAIMYGSHLINPELTPWTPVAPIALAEGIQGPMLFMSGGADQNPSPEDVKTLDATMKKLGKSFTYHIWEGDPPAGHAFFDGPPGMYNETAANWGWPIKLGFLKENL